MNVRRYSKILAGIGTGLILLALVGTSANAAAGDTTRVSVASDGTQGSGYSVGIHLFLLMGALWRFLPMPPTW